MNPSSENVPIKIRKRYYGFLSSIIKSSLSITKLPDGYKAKAFFSTQGVGIKMTNPQGKQFSGGFIPTLIFQTDYQSTQGMVKKIFDTIELHKKQINNY